VFFRKGEVLIQQSNSELGVYGTFVGEGGEVLLNKYAGFLLRTKSEGCDEGGVATGYSVLDSIALY
jgi:glutathione synthase